MLKFNQLSLRRGNKQLFQDVTLTINPKVKVGITGANGTGKTSLFKLILGQLQADTGDLYVSNKLVLAHVAQEMPDCDKSALDFVLDGDAEFRQLEEAIVKAEKTEKHDKLSNLYDHMQHIDGYSANARAAKLLNGLGFSNAQENHQVNTFSGGWRMRLN